MQEQLGNIAKK